MIISHAHVHRAVVLVTACDSNLSTGQDCEAVFFFPESPRRHRPAMAAAGRLDHGRNVLWTNLCPSPTQTPRRPVHIHAYISCNIPFPGEGKDSRPGPRDNIQHGSLRNRHAKPVDKLWKVDDPAAGPGQGKETAVIVGYYRRIEAEEGGTPSAILRAERCLRIETDPVGRDDSRTVLLGDLGGGDVLVSPSIAHLAVSVGDLLRVCHRVHRAGATLRLAAEHIDTSIAAARNALVALAEFDRRLLAARRRTGCADAHLRGAQPGRPRKLDDTLVRTIRDDLAAGRTYASIARTLGVHPTTVMRMLQRAETQTGGE